MKEESDSAQSDTLHLQNEPKLTNLLEDGQKIVFSTLIMKFNKDNKGQQRIFLLTNQAVLNILKSSNIIKSLMKKLINFQNSFRIKRRIALTNIYGITTSPNKKSNRFLLHVCNEHDYNYKAYDNKMIILKYLSVEFEKINKRLLSFYFKDEVVLVNYCTFKSHLKDKKELKPKQTPHYLDGDYFNEICFENKQYQLQYARDSIKISIKDFAKTNAFALQKCKQYFRIKQIEKDQSRLKAIFRAKQLLLTPSYCFSSQNKYYLFIPFIEGGTLLDYLSTRIPLKNNQLLFYVSLMLIFIEKLQEEHLYYNQLVLNKMYVKQNGYLVFDGINDGIEQIKQNRLSIKGNNAYISPQAITLQGYGKQALIWKAGICAHFLSTAEYPFQGNNIKQLYLQILDKPILKSVPNYVYLMLEKDKNKRITVQQLKCHSDFQLIDWQKLKKEELKAPFTSHSGHTPKVSVVYELLNN